MCRSIRAQLWRLIYHQPGLQLLWSPSPRLYLTAVVNFGEVVPQEVSWNVRKVRHVPKMSWDMSISPFRAQAICICPGHVFVTLYIYPRHASCHVFREPYLKSYYDSQPGVSAMIDFVQLYILLRGRILATSDLLVSLLLIQDILFLLCFGDRSLCRIGCVLSVKHKGY